jgi:hypothetical protein
MERRIAFLILLIAFIAATAYANAGAPLLAFVWPLFWLALVPIVAVEAWLAKRMLELRGRRAFALSLSANAVSTLVGIPLLWALWYGVLLVSEPLLPYPRSAVATIAQVTAFGPIFVPDAGNWRQVAYLSAIFLIPAFFLSVLTERLVARRFVPPEKAEAVREWSWRANLYTYEGMLVLLLAFALLDRLP